jgi:hypothetical protein
MDSNIAKPQKEVIYLIFLKDFTSNIMAAVHGIHTHVSYLTLIRVKPSRLLMRFFVVFRTPELYRRVALLSRISHH